ncbi:MAG: hypothetical protein ACP5QZ_11155 [Candidatus Sumerlaeaceae bacterium]
MACGHVRHLLSLTVALIFWAKKRGLSLAAKRCDWTLVAAVTAFSSRGISSPGESSASLVLMEELAQQPGAASLLSTGMWITVTAALLAIGYATYRVVRYLRQQQEAERINEAQFEAAALAALLASNITEQNNQDSPQQEIPFTQSNLYGTIPAEAPADTQPPVDVACKQVLDRLRQAGFLDDIETFIPLHGNPKGAAILRLRNRKRVLLVPYFETEIFTERELRRCDALLFVSRSGKAVYIQSLESFLAEASFR